MTNVKLRSAANAQMIQNNDGEQVFTCKHKKKALQKVISVSDLVNPLLPQATTVFNLN